MDNVNSVNIPRFSIVIPAYNAAKFIHIAIESVLRQTVGDWELIIVENGSTDNTTNICEKYLKDKRITLLHSKKGVSEARNTGIKTAKGKWLIFLDADDQLMVDTLQSYLGIDDEYNPDLIVGEYKDKNKRYNGDKKLYKGGTLRDYLCICLNNPTKKCNATAVAFRNSIVQQYRILFDNEIKYAEDSVFFLNFFRYVHKLVTFFYPVYKVVYYSESAVRSGKRKLDKAYTPAINMIGTIIDISDPYIKNMWYVFTLNQFLVIMVNDIFIRKESVIMQIKDAEDVMGGLEYRNAIRNVDLTDVHGLKKIVFIMMKIHFWPGIVLAIKIRQRQNKKKEDMFYV